MSETDLLKTKSDDEILEMLSKGENAFVVQRFEAIKKEVVDRGLAPKYNQTKFLVQRKDGKQTGPHTAAEIKALFSQGELTKDSKIHVQSIYGWTNLSSVFDVGLWQRPIQTSMEFKEENDTQQSSSEMRTIPPVTSTIEGQGTGRPNSSLELDVLADSLKPLQTDEAKGDSVEETILPPRISDGESRPQPPVTGPDIEPESGIGRSSYAAIAIPLLFLQVVFNAASGPQGSGGALFLGFLCTVGLIWASVLRLRNIGKSGGWAALMLIPCLGFFMLLYCLFSPTSGSSKNLSIR